MQPGDPWITEADDTLPGGLTVRLEVLVIESVAPAEVALARLETHAEAGLDAIATLDTAHGVTVGGPFILTTGGVHYPALRIDLSLNVFHEWSAD